MQEQAGVKMAFMADYYIILNVQTVQFFLLYFSFVLFRLIHKSYFSLTFSSLSSDLNFTVDVKVDVRF